MVSLCRASPRGALFVVLLTGLLCASPALAKSPPDKLTVTGPGLTEPVEVTKPVDLAGFSSWGRGFVAWSRGLVAAPPLERTYTIAFQLDGETGRDLGERGLIDLAQVGRHARCAAGGRADVRRELVRLCLHVDQAARGKSLAQV